MAYKRRKLLAKKWHLVVVKSPVAEFWPNEGVATSSKRRAEKVRGKIIVDCSRFFFWFVRAVELFLSHKSGNSQPVRSRNSTAQYNWGFHRTDCTQFICSLKGIRARGALKVSTNCKMFDYFIIKCTSKESSTSWGWVEPNLTVGIDNWSSVKIRLKNG